MPQEGPVMTNVHILHTRSVAVLGWGGPRCPCSHPLCSFHPAAHRYECQLHLLIIRFPSCPLGLLHQFQEVLVALSGHDGIPCGTAKFSDLGSGQEACPARDGGLIQWFFHILAFCKETTAGVLRISEQPSGKHSQAPWHINS